jgi:hypothetical protein
VLTHFFGLHQSEYQWMMDAVEREERIEQQEVSVAAARAIDSSVGGSESVTDRYPQLPSRATRREALLSSGAC